MKFILTLTLALTATLAQADTIAYIDNNAGGKIELTDLACGTNNKAYFQGGRLMLAYTKGGNTVSGCWYWDKQMAVVRGKWEDGTFSTYSADMLNMMK